MNRSNAARLSWRRVSRPLAGLMLLWVTGCGGGASLTAPVVAEPPNCKTTVASGFSGDLNALFPNAGGDSTGGDGGSGDGGSGDGGGGDGSLLPKIPEMRPPTLIAVVVMGAGLCCVYCQ